MVRREEGLESKVVETELMLFKQKRKQMMLDEFFSSIYTNLQSMRTEFSKSVMFSRKSDVIIQKRKLISCNVTKEGINS